MFSSCAFSSTIFITCWIKLSTYYVVTYDFTWEIEKLSQIYYNDSNRLKNLRLLIINSLNDKNLVEKLETILIKL